MKEKYIYTIIENGEIKFIERIETEEEMQERVKCYRRNNIKVKKVVKEVVQVMYIDVKY